MRNAKPGSETMLEAGDYRRGGYKAMTNIVNHDAKAFQGPDSKQGPVAGLSKDDLIVGFVAFRAENGISDVALDLLLGGSCKDAFAARCDSDALQDVCG